MHWAVKYIGLPWTPQGFGPQEFNCWGLVWWVQRNQFARDLPQHAFVSPYDRVRMAREMETAVHGSDWLELPKPMDGCVVGLSSSRIVHHVGLYADVDGGLVVHSCEGKGVLAQSVSNLRATGWNLIKFYAHRTWPTS